MVTFTQDPELNPDIDLKVDSYLKIVCDLDPNP
jgi:hypothetical protein